jgi:hypothetical protein
MYSFWSDSPSPGIEPRIPTVSGSSDGSHTSIVAHSSCDCKSLRSAAVVWPDAGDGGAAADAAGASAEQSPTVTVSETDRHVARTTL